MASFEKQCIELRKQDKSINEIVEITGRAKSSIYPYIKDIPLSKKRMRSYRKKSGKRIRKFALERKGKSAFNRHPIEFKKWTPDLVLLFSHLLFDGQIIRTGCIYNSSHKVLIERVQKMMGLIYDHKPSAHYDNKTLVHRISYHNVELGNFAQTKSKELLDSIESFGKDLQKSFLTGFFDDEGCVSFSTKNHRRRIRGYQNDRSVLKLIQKLLINFEIESKIQPNACDELVITRKENIVRFRDQINFSPEVRVNGKRSNSIWGESLEKREILDRAIASYQT